MAGDWITNAADGTIIEERWSVPAAGSMIGTSRTMKDGKTVFFEVLRLDSRGEHIAYIAAPAGRFPPTPFPLSEQGANRAVF